MVLNYKCERQHCVAVSKGRTQLDVVIIGNDLGQVVVYCKYTAVP